PGWIDGVEAPEAELGHPDEVAPDRIADRAGDRTRWGLQGDPRAGEHGDDQAVDRAIRRRDRQAIDTGTIDLRAVDLDGEQRDVGLLVVEDEDARHLARIVRPRAGLA